MAEVAQALEYVSFQDAWLRSCESGSWTDVVRLAETGIEVQA